MKKNKVAALSFVVTMLLPATSRDAQAGGYLTNTNQSISFVRNPSCDGAIGIDGVYYNPAGVLFMKQGCHLSFNWQSVFQNRDCKVFNPLFQNNFRNPSEEGYRTFEGRVRVPVQPSLMLAYNRNDWSFQFGFGFIGGGGECEFENGVGMFENMISVIPQKLRAAGAEITDEYALDAYMKGRSYDLGFTLGVARKIVSGLSGYVGLRGIYVTNNYTGHINNISFRSASGNTIPSSAFSAYGVPSDLSIDCDQTAFGVAPIIGLDWKINNHWNVAAKYEFKTSLRLKNNAVNSAEFEQFAISQAQAGNNLFMGFSDNTNDVPSDMPGLLTLGVQYSPVESLRLLGGYHHYFDTDTRQWTKDVLGNTYEFSFGAEYDINKMLEISAGYQQTMYTQEERNINDLSFNLNSWSFGLGVGVHISSAVKVNAGYFHTNYIDYTTENKSTYSRTNNVIGVGVELSF